MCKIKLFCWWSEWRNVVGLRRGSCTEGLERGMELRLGGPCTVRSNASWVIATWHPLPIVLTSGGFLVGVQWVTWVNGSHGTPYLDRMTDRHHWKHYLSATSLKSGNKTRAEYGVFQTNLCPFHYQRSLHSWLDSLLTLLNLKRRMHSDKGQTCKKISCTYLNIRTITKVEMPRTVKNQTYSWLLPELFYIYLHLQGHWYSHFLLRYCDQFHMPTGVKTSWCNESISNKLDCLFTNIPGTYWLSFNPESMIRGCISSKLPPYINRNWCQ